VRRSIKLGSYCARDRLIRVHPRLDDPSVPRFFVEYVVYHEMLHHVLPPDVRGGRRQLHDARFKRMERAFPRYDDAIAWESQNVRQLLWS
jgi:predicted metal-dependent hydrolase